MIALATTKIIATVEGGIGWLTFNHRSAATPSPSRCGRASAMRSKPSSTTTRARGGDEGAGGKAFASGADISEFDQQRANAEQRKRYGEIAARGNLWLAQLDKPLLAMIQGFCIGAGSRWPQRDVRFATAGSTFGIPREARPRYEYAGVAKLARLVGRRRRATSCSARAFSTPRRRCASAAQLRRPRRRARGARPRLRRHDRRQRATHRARGKASVNALRVLAPRRKSRARRLVDACFDSDDYKEAGARSPRSASEVQGAERGRAGPSPWIPRNCAS